MSRAIEIVIEALIAIALLCLVVVWISTQVRGNMEKADTASQQLDNTTESLLESEFTIYEASERTGSTVISIVSKYEQEGTKICIEVDNGSGSYVPYCYANDLTAKSDNKIVDAKNKSDLTTYINPKAPFLGHVVRDEATGSIIGLQFKNNVNGDASFEP